MICMHIYIYTLYLALQMDSYSGLIPTNRNIYNPIEHQLNEWRCKNVCHSSPVSYPWHTYRSQTLCIYSNVHTELSRKTLSHTKALRKQGAQNHITIAGAVLLSFTKATDGTRCSFESTHDKASWNVTPKKSKSTKNRKTKERTCPVQCCKCYCKCSFSLSQK